MSVAEPEAAPSRALPPRLRLLPAPCSEPPYDDELPTAPVLRLVPSALPLPAAPAPAAAPVPAEATVVLPLRDDDGPSRTALADLPPVRPFAQALVQRLLEVRAGLRPLGQLQRDTSLELYDALERRLTTRPRPSGPRPGARDVRSVHVQARPDGVAEVCATVHRSGRMTALALRLEGRGGAWRCTELLGL